MNDTYDEILVLVLFACANLSLGTSAEILVVRVIYDNQKPHDKIDNKYVRHCKQSSINFVYLSI